MVVEDPAAYPTISRLFGDVVVEQAAAQKGDVSSDVGDGAAVRLPSIDTYKLTSSKI